MSYETIIAFRASAQMRLALDRLAQTCETDIGKIIRPLVAREIGIVRDPLADLREQVLFAAIGIDDILMHLDPALCAKIAKFWQERIGSGATMARKRLAFGPCPDTLPLPFEPLTVRIPVAVRLTGIGRSKLYELIRAGDIETVKIGTATLVKVASLRRLTERGCC